MTETQTKTVSSEIFAKQKPKTFPIKLVAIDGHGGSGKSTLAEQLAQTLSAEILHTDDFASWDNSQMWWPLLIQYALDPITRGAQELSYPRSSWASGHHPEAVNGQKVTPIMILEGVSSARKEFRPYLTYAIWVETPKKVCIGRGMERDGKDKFEQWEKWWAAEEGYINEHRPKMYADIKISGQS